MILDTPSFPYKTESNISNHLPLADSSKKKHGYQMGK